MRRKRPYHKRKPARKQIELFCDEAWPDDGVDPRRDGPDHPAAKPGRPGRKALQLCRQVQRALDFALGTGCRDPLLRELRVVSVEPAPHSGRLRVTLQLDPSVKGVEVCDVMRHLEGAAGKLRSEAAAAIHRRKTPELAFCILSNAVRRNP